jgi:hypothetical protein
MANLKSQNLRFEICDLQFRALRGHALGLAGGSCRWFDKLTTLSKVEGPVGGPAHPTRPLGLTTAVSRGLGERAAASSPDGDPKIMVTPAL